MGKLPAAEKAELAFIKRNIMELKISFSIAITLENWMSMKFYRKCHFHVINKNKMKSLLPALLWVLCSRIFVVVVLKTLENVIKTSLTHAKIAMNFKLNSTRNRSRHRQSFPKSSQFFIHSIWCHEGEERKVTTVECSKVERCLRDIFTHIYENAKKILIHFVVHRLKCFVGGLGCAGDTRTRLVSIKWKKSL